jgi:hypothetical protein
LPPRPASLRVVVSVAVFLAFSCGSARAQWVRNGTPVGRADEDQFLPRVSADPSGGAFVTWGNLEGRFQHLTSDGQYAPGWPATGGQLPTGPQHFKDLYPVSVSDGVGGFFVVWYASGEGCRSGCNYAPARLWVMRYSTDGTPASGWTSGAVMLTGLLGYPGYEPAIAPDGAGGVLIAWNQGGIRAQRVDANGHPLWGPEGAAACSESATLSPPAIVGDEGGAFVFWGDHRSSGADSRVFGQHLTPSGDPSWRENGVPISTEPVHVQGFVELPPVAVTDGARGVVVAWTGVVGGQTVIAAARVNHGGELPWKGDIAIRRGDTEATWLRLIARNDGGADLAWIDSRRAPSGDVYAQAVGRNGKIAWSVNGVLVCGAVGKRGPLCLASDDRNGAYIAWGDSRPAGELFATHLDGDGATAAGWPSDGTVVCEDVPTVSSFSTSIASLAISSVAGGNAIVAWQDTRPVHPWLDGAACAAMLLRPTGPAASGPAMVVLDDASAPSSEASVDTRTAAFALREISPNPVSGGAWVHFSLRSGGRATLDVLDVSGRRVSARSLDVGPGDHAVPLAAGAALRPGVYFVRLRQGTESATARAVVVR